ncbi:hypothetical protein LguiA_008236 [Lonicera macranthoides]
MIPIKYLSKMGTYDINILGQPPLKVRVTNHPAIVDIGISELRSQLSGICTSVVGVNIIRSDDNNIALQLCVGNCCLVIHRSKYSFANMKDLQDFLYDKEICFVSVNKVIDSVIYRTDYFRPSKNMVEVSELATRVLKDKNLLVGSGLETLAAKVGLNFSWLEEKKGNVSVDWGSVILSNEQIEKGVRDVFACYLIANKLLASL